jgi:hypothetical protein
MDLHVLGRDWHRHLTLYRVSEWERLRTAVRTGLYQRQGGGGAALGPTK